VQRGISRAHSRSVPHISQLEILLTSSQIVLFPAVEVPTRKTIGAFCAACFDGNLSLNLDMANEILILILWGRRKSNFSKIPESNFSSDPKY